MPCNAKNGGKEWPAGFNALYNIFSSQKFMEYWFSVNYYQNTLVFFLVLFLVIYRNREPGFQYYLQLSV